MDFVMLMVTVGSLMCLLPKAEVSQVLEECWLLSNQEKFSYSPS